jgi:hypothetical protein
MLDLDRWRVYVTEEAEFITLGTKVFLSCCNLRKVVKHGYSKYRLTTFRLLNYAAMHHSGYSLFAVGIVPQISRVPLNAQELFCLRLRK